jgi:hypothetical protein
MYLLESKGCKLTSLADGQSSLPLAMTSRMIRKLSVSRKSTKVVQLNEGFDVDFGLARTLLRREVQL